MTAFVLQFFDGVGKVKSLPISGNEATLGRGESCDIQLDKEGLEELHCRFLTQGTGVMFKDESAKRDAKINGKTPRRGEGRLKPGDELSLGELTFVLQTQEQAEADAKKRKKQSAERKRKKKESAEASKSPARRSAVKKAPKKAPAPKPEPEPVSSEDLDEYEDDYDDEYEEGESYSDRLAYRRQRQMQQWARSAVPIVIVLIVAWFFLNKMKNNDFDDEDQQVTDSRDSKKTKKGDSGSSGPVKAEKEADLAWSRLQKLDAKSLIKSLEGFSGRFPKDHRAADARFYAKLLKRQGSGGTGRVLTKLLSEAKKVEFAGDWGRSYSLLALAVAIDPRKKAGIQAKREQLRIERMAGEAFEDLSARANLMAQNMGPVQALILVLESRDLYRGLSFEERMDALVKNFEDQIASQSERRGPGDGYSAEASTLEHDAIQLALRLKIKPAREKLDQILELNLSEKDRFKVHWLRQQVLALRDLVNEMIALGSKSFKERPELTLPGKIKARLKDADETHLILSAEKGRGELRWPWDKLTPFQIQELFDKVTPTDLRLCEAKSFHAFKTGLSDTGFEILIPFAKKKRYRSEVFSFYSLVTGADLPAGGYVIFERRFVDPEARDQLIADRAAAKEAAASVVAASAEEKKKEKLLALLKKVLGLMDQGFYTNGKQALAKLADLHGDVEGVGDVARARLESPMLRRRDIKLSRKKGRNGPSKNRLDIYFMGDGFLLGDQKQRHFDRNADAAQGIVSLQDFFKEYDNFINYWAVNLESNEEGVERDGKTKDTALGTAIVDGRYMVRDRARVFSILDKWFPGEHDRQAVVIGNDHANIATGGGGTAAVCKTMLQATPHEIGHAYGGLGDEYNREPGGGAPNPYTGPFRIIAPNVIAGNDKAELLKNAPWKGWLDKIGTNNWSGKPVDVFEGANRQPKGYWRPQRVCCMKDSGSPFCVVCMEVMVRRLYEYVKPIDQVWPKENELTAEKKPVTFRVLVLKPRTHDVMVHWRLKTLGKESSSDGSQERDGPVKNVSGRLQVIDGFYVHYIKVRPEDLPPGRYEISAQAWDPTPWVREEFRKELTAWQRWTLEVPESVGKVAGK